MVMDKMNIDKKTIGRIITGMLVIASFLMIALSSQSSTNAIGVLITVYFLMCSLIVYIIIDFSTSGKVNNLVNEAGNMANVLAEGVNTNAISGFGKFMKLLSVLIIIITIALMIANLSLNYDKIVNNLMPSSYYNFTTLINIFLTIQLLIMASNLLSSDGNLYTISDKMTMISIFFGQLGFMMLMILIIISRYYYTQG